MTSATRSARVGGRRVSVVAPVKASRVVGLRFMPRKPARLSRNSWPRAAQDQIYTQTRVRPHVQLLSSRVTLGNWWDRVPDAREEQCFVFRRIKGGLEQLAVVGRPVSNWPPTSRRRQCRLRSSRYQRRRWLRRQVKYLPSFSIRNPAEGDDDAVIRFQNCAAWYPERCRDCDVACDSIRTRGDEERLARRGRVGGGQRSPIIRRPVPNGPMVLYIDQVRKAISHAPRSRRASRDCGIITDVRHRSPSDFIVALPARIAGLAKIS